MYSLLKILACILLLNSLAWKCAAQSTQSNCYKYAIDSLLDAPATAPFNGVVLLARDGKILYTRGGGQPGNPLAKSLDINTSFAIGSLTKQVTAVLVLQAVAKGKLQLKEPVRKYLPGLPRTWADTVTLHHLLNHTAGVTGTDEPLAFGPGTACAYSNAGYQLLGQILEKVNAQPYGAQVQQLFKRCGMLHSGYPGFVKQGSLITCYIQEGDSLKAAEQAKEILPLMGAAGGLTGTASDLLRWNNKLHHGKLLPDSLYRLMVNPFPEAIRVHSVFDTVYYSYSIPIKQEQGLAEFCQSGFLPQSGFYCVNLYYPATKTSIILLEHVLHPSDDFREIFHYELAIRERVKRCGL